MEGKGLIPNQEDELNLPAIQLLDNSTDNPAGIPFETKLSSLRERVEQKSEHLRQLKLVKSYREKEATGKDLNEVTGQWLKACQQGLQDFHGKVKENMVEEDPSIPASTMTEFIEKLGIDKSLVKFDELTDSFVK